MKPKIFTYTIYRLPTKEELIDVNNSQLNADEIINGFTYTIVGRGIKSPENKKMIINSIKLLHDLYPDNMEYKIALNRINDNNLIKIINEEISAINRDKKQEIFDYKSEHEDTWNEPKREAQKFQRINFDFENDDVVAKKTFNIKKNLRKDQPIKYTIQAEMRIAGGDWEMGVIYFRIEFTHDYGVFSNKWYSKKEFVFDNENYKGRKFCLIPPVEAGNKLQKKEGDGSTGSSDKYDWFAYQNDELSKEDEKIATITDNDKQTAWKWLQNLLEKTVNERHEMLDK